MKARSVVGGVRKVDKFVGKGTFVRQFCRTPIATVLETSRKVKSMKGIAKKPKGTEVGKKSAAR